MFFHKLIFYTYAWLLEPFLEFLTLNQIVTAFLKFNEFLWIAIQKNGMRLLSSH